ncbi:TIGR02646 family protein [Rubritalea tangerina]|uniref:TIGR02646 family protein n=2 Tax=Rubritalea tangerina TaxID=430798 RepID=A0ABW4ZET3_9BACT
MRQINKGIEPSEFTTWKRGNPDSLYSDLPHPERRAIRQSCIDEQLGLCCYCCRSITIDDSSNEHLKDRDHFPQHQLDYSNITASCRLSGRCNDFRNNQAIGISPLDGACETEITYYLSGKIKGLTDSARTTISATNLKSLKEERKGMVNALIWGSGENPDELELLENDLIDLFIAELDTPIDGTLSSYAPVLVSILKSLKG